MILATVLLFVSCAQVSLQDTVYAQITEYLEDAVKTYAKDYPIPDDFGLNIFEYLEKHGYECESHNVTTEDGYILNLQRLPQGKNGDFKNTSRPAVLMMHGLLATAMDWVYLGQNKSLGLILADGNYDVWLGNNRGTRWSRKHETLDPEKDSKFWDFSFHEFGYYDVPAFIDYILNTTGHEQLYYIGHSQGTAQFFAMSSTRPEYNEKVAHMTALAPIAYLHRQTSIVPKYLAKYLTLVQLLCKYFKITDLVRRDYNIFSQFAIILCGDGSPFQELCAQVIFLAAGEDSPQLNRTWLPVMLSNTPDDASIKTFVHLLQLIREDSFKQYDYGVIGNLQRYKKISPPTYDLNQIKVPVAIYFAQNDLFNNKEDVDKLASQLPNLVKFHTVEYEKFSHTDFVLAKDADLLVYNEFLEYLNDVSGNNEGAVTEKPADNVATNKRCSRSMVSAVLIIELLYTLYINLCNT